MMPKNRNLDRVTKPSSSLDRWLNRRGLSGNPFEKWNAENDWDLPTYFVDIVNIDEFSQLEIPSIIFAQRGCGKTAQKQMVAIECRPIKSDSTQLSISYTYNGFERVLESVNYDIDQIRPQHHVNAILYLGFTALWNEVTKNERLQKLIKSEPLAHQWDGYTSQYVSHLSNSPHLSNPNNIERLSSVELLQDFWSILVKLGMETCVVLVDGLDEFPYTSDPSQAIKFLAPLLGTLSIIECPGFSFKFFLPKELEAIVLSCKWFRQDRIQIIPIKWKASDFLHLIEHRLASFSIRDQKYKDLAELCDDELGAIIDDELITLAGELPRNILILADRLLRFHCKGATPSDRIKLESWQKVKDWWINSHERVQSTENTVSEQGVQHPLLKIDAERGTVTLGKSEIRSKFKGKIYSMLLFLYKHRGEVCNKTMIIENVWSDIKDGNFVMDQTIAANISRLRKVLNGNAPDSEYIETIKGKTRSEAGYRLVPQGFDKTSV